MALWVKLVIFIETSTELKAVKINMQVGSYFKLKIGWFYFLGLITTCASVVEHIWQP